MGSLEEPITEPQEESEQWQSLAHRGENWTILWFPVALGPWPGGWGSHLCALPIWAGTTTRLLSSPPPTSWVVLSLHLRLFLFLIVSGDSSSSLLGFLTFHLTTCPLVDHHTAIAPAVCCLLLSWDKDQIGCLAFFSKPGLCGGGLAPHWSHILWSVASQGTNSCGCRCFRRKVQRW